MRTLAALIVVIAVWWFGRIGFGTFIVDPAMLFICGCFVTYFIFRFAVQKSPGWLRRFYLMLFIISIILLWLGGILPYYNIVDSKEVYRFINPLVLYVVVCAIIYLLLHRFAIKELTQRAQTIASYFFVIAVIFLWFGAMVRVINNPYDGLLPQSFVGPLDGNDFMWNGLGVITIFGRIVPKELIPTYQYFWFNALAWFMWFVAFIPIQGLGVLVGRSLSFTRNWNPIRMALTVVAVFAIGISLSLITISVTLALVHFYQ